MKPEELYSLSQELNRQATKFLEEKEKKENEGENFKKEVEKILIKIIEEEKNNLTPDNIFSWDGRRRLQDNGNTWLGNYIASKTNSLLATSTYIITEKGVNIDLIYNRRSDMLDLDQDVEEKIKKALREKNIIVRFIYISPNRYKTEIVFINNENTNEKENKIQAAFKEYRERRKQIENEIKKSPITINKAVETISQDICNFLRAIIEHETNNLDQSSVQEITKEGQINRNIDLDKTTLTLPDIIASSFCHQQSTPKYIISGDSIELSYIIPPNSFKLIGGDLALDKLKKELSEYSIEVSLTKNDCGSLVKLKYLIPSQKKEKSSIIERALLGFMRAFATEGLDNEDKRNKDKDNFIRSVFSLIGETIKKLDNEKGQITYLSRDLKESGIEGLKRLVLKSENQIPINNTKELEPIRSYFTFDPEKLYIEYKFYFTKDVENTIFRLLDDDLIQLLENNRIEIKIEKTWSEYKCEKRHLGYIIVIKYKLEKDKDTRIGQVLTLSKESTSHQE